MLLTAYLTAEPPPALRPELVALVDAGLLARAAARDAGERGEVALTVPRGALTRAQAAALAALLGLGAAPANDRA